MPLTEPVPTGCQGAVVPLADTGRQEDGSKGRFFAAVAIGGKDIQNALLQTREASDVNGMTLTSLYTTRNVPVTTMKVKLVGTHQTAAPIHQIASRLAGTYFSVEGVVEFTPAEGHRYEVTGVLQKERSCVWIADAGSPEPVTGKVCSE